MVASITYGTMIWVMAFALLYTAHVERGMRLSEIKGLARQGVRCGAAVRRVPH